MTEALVPTEQLDFSVDYQPTKIVINNQDKLERALKAYVNKYSGLVVSEQTLKDDKKVKKELNSLKKQLNFKRIEIHKMFDQPYTDFKSDIDDMISQIDEVVNPINEGISKFEEQQKQQRLEDVKAEIAEMAPNYDIQPDEIEIDKSWLTKSFSESKRVKAIADQMGYIRQQHKIMESNILAVVEHAKTVDIEPDGWVEQLRQGQDVSYVISAIDNAVAKKKAVEEKARKQAEYQNEMDKLRQKQVGDVKIDTSTGEIVQEPAVDDKQISCTLKITANKERLWQVRNFLDDNHIKFETIKNN